MEPVLYSLRAVTRGASIITLSLSVFAQVPAAPDASSFPLGRKASDFLLTALPPALIPRPVFEFRGIRIGDELKKAERKFLALNVPSFSSKHGEYVNMTMLDRRVAQIYVSTDRRTQGNSYNSYVVALGTKYGRPDKLETSLVFHALQAQRTMKRVLAAGLARVAG